MSELYELHDRPSLDVPVLVLAMRGWIDAGLAAATALDVLTSDHEWSPVATFDADRLLDYRARRPTLQLVDGESLELRWPSTTLLSGADLDGRDVLLLVGEEPDHAWRAFSDTVIDLARSFDVRLVTGLGAYPAPVPHTRPSKLAATASSRKLADLVGFVPGEIEVPAGVHAAIEQAAAAADLPAVGLWAQVPHYVAATEYPGAALALIEGLHRVAGLRFSIGDLPERAEEVTQRINDLVARNEEHYKLVTDLESRASVTEGLGDLPTGDDLAEELERFLREQGDG